MIDKATLISRITKSKETKDYTYAILFLLISSFFAVAVIKPVMTIAVSLQKEAKDLRKVNDVFEKNIITMVQLQNQMQEIRPQSYLVDIAIPEDPHMRVLIADIRTVALNEGINVVNIDVNEANNGSNSQRKQSKIPLKPEFYKPITMKLAIDADFNAAVRFTKLLMNQRRLKVIRTIGITKKSNKEGGDFLTINLEIEGYYL